MKNNSISIEELEKLIRSWSSRDSFYCDDYEDVDPNCAYNDGFRSAAEELQSLIDDIKKS